MPLQTSGSISLGDIHVEAAGSVYAGTSESSLNDADIRGLTPASGFTINSTPNTTISIGDFYGASASTVEEGLSDSLDSISGTSDAWSTRTVDISDYAGSEVRLVFGYTNGSQGTSYQGDIQLDDIRLDGTTYSFENTGHSWQTTTSDTQIANYSTASFSTLSTGTTTNRWNVDSGGTPSGSTGRTDADAGSYYVYAETSSGAAGRGYVLRSPAVTLGSSPTLSYAVARKGNNIGALNVYLDVITGGSGGGGSGGSGSGSNTAFNSFSYAAVREDQSQNSFGQVTSASDDAFAAAVGSFAFRLRLASNVLHFEVKRVQGNNGTRYDSNSSGVYDSTNTSISTSYVSLGTISVPSPVDVKVNWAFTLSGTGGTGSIVGNTAQTGATYSLSDNTFRTLTNGQSAGFLATVSNTRSTTGSQSRYLVINNLPLTLQKSGYTTEEVADFEGQLTAIAVVSGGGGTPP